MPVRFCLHDKAIAWIFPWPHRTPTYASLHWIKACYRDEACLACTCSICEALHNAPLLLDNVVDLHLSMAKFLSERAVALVCLNGFDHLHFHERHYHLCPFYGIPVDCGAGCFAGMSMSWYVCEKLKEMSLSSCQFPEG